MRKFALLAVLGLLALLTLVPSAVSGQDTSSASLHAVVAGDSSGGAAPAQALAPSAQGNDFAGFCMALIIDVFFDLGEHDQFIDLGVLLGACFELLSPGPLTTSNLQAGDTVTITAPDPWVDVTGVLQPDGTLIATGQGTVAGFPNVTVKFEGTLGPGSALTLAGKYTMGVNGELPGGQPIIYTVLGHQLLQGDVDCDGIVGTLDALKEQMWSAGLSVTQAEPCPDIATEVASLWGDVGCNSALDLADSIKLQQHVASLPVTQTEPCPDIGTPILLEF